MSNYTPFKDYATRLSDEAKESLINYLRASINANAPWLETDLYREGGWDFEENRPKMYSHEEVITVERATDLLENHNTNNRKIGKSQVIRYASDVKKGNFAVTHQSIGIDRNGNLVDGQHRLKAIIISNTPCKLLVTYNAVQDPNCDRQKTRAENDTLNMSHLSSFKLQKHHIALATLAIIISTNIPSEQISTLAKNEWLTDNFDALDKLEIAHGDTARLATMVSVMLAMITAYNNGYDPKKIKRWRDVLTSGIINNLEEQSAVLLRNRLLNTRIYSQTERIQTLKTCQLNLYHFLHNDTVKTIKTPKDFVWEVK